MFEIAKIINEAMNENVRDDPEVEKSLNNIDGDGIQADHHERERPFPVTLYVDNPIE
jgi:hypothetical protein